MENLIVAEVDILVLLAGYLVGISVVDIINLSLLIPVSFDIFRKKLLPYRSTARVVPRAFFIMAIGEKPTSPLKPSPGMWKISSLRK